MLRVLSVAAVAATTLLATTAYAQRGPRPGAGGWGPAGQYQRIYDTDTVETVKGEIEQIDRVTPMRGMSPGVHLVLKTDEETVSVHLGPAWYLDNQDVKLEPEDEIEVKGSRVTVAGKPALIAAEVTKGDQVLTLRDDRGIPQWSGWRRR